MRHTAAYGSNLNMDHMRSICPDAVFVSVSWLSGYRPVFRGKFLTLEKAEGYTVPVGIWRISERDEAALDVWENYPEEYYKEYISPDCFVYLMHEHIPYELPDDDYLAMCMQGYGDAGFDTAILMDAYSYTEKKIMCDTLNT
ncbi:MAG: gamma-glutamylcyclotransferase family protein [Bullifex sp.]